MPLPSDSAARKAIPLFSGVIAYFPDALIEVAKLSQEGNDKHNPGEPLHWARGKSDDHEDCIARHGVDALKAVTLADKVDHMRARAWRSLAALQLAVEARDAEPVPDVRKPKELRVGDTVHLICEKANHSPRTIRATVPADRLLAYSGPYVAVDARGNIQMDGTLESLARNYERRP